MARRCPFDPGLKRRLVTLSLLCQLAVSGTASMTHTLTHQRRWGLNCILMSQTGLVAGEEA